MPLHESLIDVKPFSVRLHVHGDLDFFLGPRTCRGRVERRLSEKTSVKDVIESCGIPHPEVDLILVNGKAVDFAYVVTGDAEIELYPPGIQYSNFREKRLQAHCRSPSLSQTDTSANSFAISACSGLTLFMIPRPKIDN